VEAASPIRDLLDPAKRTGVFDRLRKLAVRLESINAGRLS